MEVSEGRKAPTSSLPVHHVMKEEPPPLHTPATSVYCTSNHSLSSEIMSPNLPFLLVAVLLGILVTAKQRKLICRLTSVSEAFVLISEDS